LASCGLLRQCFPQTLSPENLLATPVRPRERPDSRLSPPGEKCHIAQHSRSKHPFAT
jgi:hypothetical protein